LDNDQDIEKIDFATLDMEILKGFGITYGQATKVMELQKPFIGHINVEPVEESMDIVYRYRRTIRYANHIP
jgi:hypothetical protein